MVIPSKAAARSIEFRNKPSSRLAILSSLANFDLNSTDIDAILKPFHGSRRPHRSAAGLCILTAVMNLKERTYLWHISLLRIYIGYYLLHQGYRKFQRDFPNGDWVGRQIGDVAALDLYPWYKRFLLDYVVPHQELFGYLVMLGELAVGACLLLGLFTRFSAVIGLFMLVNYFLGPGMARGGATLAQQQIFIVALVVFVLSNPGRTLGLDGLLFGGGKGKGAR
jgi:thiosulfate dehydrogenase [quinone] large subunit